jgi:structural maintenance of chromosome 2
MYEKTEKWHQDLLLKKATLTENKRHIKETIDQLDIEKNKDLEKTVKEVDKNLSDIFGVLLVHAGAGLRAVNDENGTLTGLQLKVSFNGVEKESLTELSGGQRSLLALSLILALLKYQPAPIYILDEIDSALDLSHTQNIG